MAATSRGLSSFGLRLRRVDEYPPPPLNQPAGFQFDVRKRRRRLFVGGNCTIKCCCSDSVVPIRRRSLRKGVEKAEEWAFDPKKTTHRVRIQATTPAALPFASSQYVFHLPNFFVSSYYILMHLYL